MSEYSQGVCMDGAAILKDGAMMTIEEIVSELREIEQLRAQLAEAQSGEAVGSVSGTGVNWVRGRAPENGDLLYTSPPAAKVPEALVYVGEHCLICNSHPDERDDDYCAHNQWKELYVNGWNACREAMLSAQETAL